MLMFRVENPNTGCGPFHDFKGWDIADRFVFAAKHLTPTDESWKGGKTWDDVASQGSAYFAFSSLEKLVELTTQKFRRSSAQLGFKVAVYEGEPILESDSCQVVFYKFLSNFQGYFTWSQIKKKFLKG